MDQYDYIRNAFNRTYDGPFPRGRGLGTADGRNAFMLPEWMRDLGVRHPGPWFPVKWDKIPPAWQQELTRQRIQRGD